MTFSTGWGGLAIWGPKRRALQGAEGEEELGPRRVKLREGGLHEVPVAYMWSPERDVDRTQGLFATSVSLYRGLCQYHSWKKWLGDGMDGGPSKIQPKLVTAVQAEKLGH